MANPLTPSQQMLGNRLLVSNTSVPKIRHRRNRIK